LPVIAARAGLGKSSTHAAIKRLENKGLVIKESYVFGRTKEQATTYRLPLPEWLVRNERLSRNESLSAGGSIKENTLKETHNTEPGVRVGSRFDLQECRRYAEHLRSSGQGINNPGGYATKIHRSGEADELIASFLTPVEAAPSFDVSKCPDCRGTGFWEPGGVGKGVAKCRHEGLLQVG
jgi:hypothetical protein